MKEFDNLSIWDLIGKRYKTHPWHGINPGKDAPEEVLAFIEVVPSDTVKYEVDKDSGYLMIDRPQKFSNIFPALYGFIPQTYCAEEVAKFSSEKIGYDVDGDGDPVDIVVLTERDVTHGDILVNCKPIGGFRMIDGGEADDKIIAVLSGDGVYGDWNDISEMPEPVKNRLLHYFLTYKLKPYAEKNPIEITHTYGRAEALEVIKRSMKDYDNHFGDLEERLTKELNI